MQSENAYDLYIEILQEWAYNSKLIQPSTLDSFFKRHVEDSIQLCPLILDKNASILDIGTGAGFPGIVLAIEGFTAVTLCDTDRKKIVFLEELTRKLALEVTILHTKVQDIVKEFDYVVSRAFADLDSLLLYFSNVSHETSTALFHKGRTWRDEIEVASKKWDYQLEIIPSITSSDGVILKIWNLKRRK